MKIIAKSTKILIVLSVLLLALSLTGCRYKRYKGKYPELYSVAINSLLWNSGQSAAAGKLVDPKIEIIEEDSYGRILFSYIEQCYARATIAFDSLLICQKSDEEFTYFYPDYNFVSIEREPYSHNYYKFSVDEIQTLKNLNDWDKEVDLEKCVKVEITRNKPKLQIDKEVFDKLFRKAIKHESENKLFIHTDFLISDNYGRSIYYGFGEEKLGSDKNYQKRYFYRVFIFNPDSSYNEETCILEPTDYYNYQDELKAFKELNNWNMPW